MRTREFQGSVTLKAAIITLAALNFGVQLSYSFLQNQELSVTLLPTKPREVLGRAGCFSMVVTLGLAEVCC